MIKSEKCRVLLKLIKSMHIFNIHCFCFYRTSNIKIDKIMKELDEEVGTFGFLIKNVLFWEFPPLFQIVLFSEKITFELYRLKYKKLWWKPHIGAAVSSDAN